MPPSLAISNGATATAGCTGTGSAVRRAADGARRLAAVTLIVLLAAGCASGSTPSDVTPREAPTGGAAALAGAASRGAASSDALPPGAPSSISSVSSAPAGTLAPSAASGWVPGQTGWVAAENHRTGVSLPPASNGAWGVQGYLDADSATTGDTVAVHLGLTGSDPHLVRRVRLNAYRIGWYRGSGARNVWTSSPVDVGQQLVPSGAAAPHLVVPDWPVAARIPIDAQWPPGFYLLLPLDARGRSTGPAVPLVVRDDSGREPILFKASTLTWNAYDDWGGWSLYHGPAGSHAQQVSDRARIVSMQRPLVGSGYDQMMSMDLPVVRRIEQLAAARGIDATYTTDTAVDAAPQQLLQHAEIVSGGHSEYWTTSMYDALRAATGAGVNAVFLGANNLWWHARLEGGTPIAPAREVVYRSAAEDPLAATDPASATVLWEAAPLSRDPAALLGQSHAGIGVRGSLRLLDPPSWYTAGTGLARDAVLTDAVGNEADGFNVAGHNPDHTQVLAAGLLTGSGGPVLVTTSYSVLSSGAAVYAAGTTDWACVPADRCAGPRVPPATARAVGILTDNVLVALSTVGAGTTHPAAATAALSPAVLRPRLFPRAVGTYGGAETDEVAHAHRPAR